MRIKIWPYKMGSSSARAIARSLGAYRVAGHSPTYRPRPNHLVINWGNSQLPVWNWRCVLNEPFAVANAAHKLRTFRCFTQGAVPSPEWTTEQTQAQAWIEEGHRVFCRTVLTGRSGCGIVVSEAPDQLVAAPLYTKGVKKKDEYRVHILKGEVIDFVQKKKRVDSVRDTSATPHVRNHTNGWVFARMGVVLPDAVRTASISAVSSLGLDFGAVDVATDREGNPYVFEVNTAPGLEGTTLQKYVQAFSSLINNPRNLGTGRD